MMEGFGVLCDQPEATSVTTLVSRFLFNAYQSRGSKAGSHFIIVRILTRAKNGKASVLVDGDAGNVDELGDALLRKGQRA